MWDTVLCNLLYLCWCQAKKWAILVMPACSSCRPCRNNSDADWMMILEPYSTKPLSDVSLSCIPVFVGYSGYLFASERSSIVCEPVDSGPHWAPLGLLRYLVLPYVTEGDVAYMQIMGKFISLMLDSLDRVSRSCIRLSGPYLILVSYCCRQRSILWRCEGVWQLLSWRQSSPEACVSF